MNSLFADVVENAYSGYGGYYGSSLSATEEAVIDERITDDPVTMVGYTSECITGMVAVEAALATVEGRCAVDYLRATTESARAEVKVTMEGAISRAWETIKDYIMRAWNAIKKFLQKAWNRIKAAAQTVRAMLTKYEKVLRDYKGDIKVTWYKELNTRNLMAAKDKLLNEVEKENARIDKAINIAKKMAKNNTLAGHNDYTGSVHKNSLTVDFKDENDNTIATDYYRNIDYRDTLMLSLYGNTNGLEYEDVKFSDKKTEILNVADSSEDKLITDNLKAGEKSEKEMLNDLRDIQSELNDLGDQGAPRKIISIANARARILIAIHREANTLLVKAVQQKRSLAVAACRKAIRAMHGVNENAIYNRKYIDKSSSGNFDAIMASMI